MSKAVSPCSVDLMLVSLDKRTTAALGDELMERLSSLQFCIVGCGGTGANFAEMLVRTGANRLVLIDGGCVKKSGLNRVFGFTVQDVGKTESRSAGAASQSHRQGRNGRMRPVRQLASA